MMKKEIIQVLPLWGIEIDQIEQVYTSAWQINGKFYFMSKKLTGSNNVDARDTRLTRQMGFAITRLHVAFVECEKAIDFWDNSLLEEMRGWIKENLKANEWQLISEEEYIHVAEQLEQCYTYHSRKGSNPVCNEMHRDTICSLLH